VTTTRTPRARLTLRVADLHQPQPGTITPGEAARLLHVSTATLASWADAGRLTATRSAGGRRTYDREQITALAAPRAEADRAEVHRVTVQAHNLHVAATMTEAVLQQRVEEMAFRLGWRSYHTHDSRRSDAGFPDLVLLRRGVQVVRELKTERGRVTPQQQAWLDDYEQAGVDAGVWRPLDLIERRVEKTLTGQS